MPITLTVPYTWPNGTRLVIATVNPNDDDSVLTVVIQLRTPPASDHVGSEAVLKIRNGLCGRVSRNTNLGVLGRWNGWLVYEPNVLTVATGYTDAMNAWKAGATPAARRTALETHMLSVGYIHSSLTGT